MTLQLSSSLLATCTYLSRTSTEAARHTTNSTACFICPRDRTRHNHDLGEKKTGDGRLNTGIIFPTTITVIKSWVEKKGRIRELTQQLLLQPIHLQNQWIKGKQWLGDLINLRNKNLKLLFPLHSHHHEWKQKGRLHEMTPPWFMKPPSPLKPPSLATQSGKKV